MNETLLYILGIILLVLGLAISIGLHEFGHLIPAKIFGVKVPHWAIGFGPKLWSKKFKETEYSVRLIPLGGFITMIGMFPPEDKKKPDSKRFFGRLIAQSREAHSEYMEVGDEKRTLYSKPAWQRIIVMFGGPFVNLVLGLALIVGALSGIGTWQQGAKLAEVIECTAQMLNSKDLCPMDSEKTPAFEAGLRSGDVIQSVDGKAVTTANDYIEVVTAKPLVSHSLVVDRAGESVTITMKAKEASLPTQDPITGEVSNQMRPYLGVQAEYVRLPWSLTESASFAGGSAIQTFGFIGQFPVAVYTSVSSLFDGQARGEASAISVVGIGQVAGTVTASEGDFADKAYSIMMLLGSLNLALFAFNMIPIPPLDGGHILGGVYEYVKRGWFRLLGRKGKVRVDTALMAPVAQFGFMLLLVAGVAMILVDLVNPVKI